MGGEIKTDELSDSDDTETMIEILTSSDTQFDVGDAGTVMRFIVAYLAIKDGTWEVTGSDRMKERPIKELVDVLNKLGAKIGYMDKDGAPPLRIFGLPLAGGEIEVDGSVSSQYISALMMIAPYMEKGLKIKLTGQVVSAPYIEMTASVMRSFGAKVEMRGGRIEIEHGNYSPVDYVIEPDWTSASYFYELLSVGGRGCVKFAGLKVDSVQGDAMQIELWKRLGVTTLEVDDGILITGNDVYEKRLEYDFIGMPDLVQSFVVACCLKNIPFVFSGIRTLRDKETDRIKALICELAKLGFILSAEGQDRLIWDGTKCTVKDMTLDPHNDHRMAMALAPAALVFPGLIIKNSKVVRKSFPGYWYQFVSFCQTAD